MGGGRPHNSLQHFGNLERSFNWIVTKRASRVGCASGIYGPPLSLSLYSCGGRRSPLTVTRAGGRQEEEFQVEEEGWQRPFVRILPVDSVIQ